MTLSVAKRPFGDDFVQDYSGPTVTAYGEVPWQLQQLHLNTQHPPVTPYWNTRPLPSPPVACMKLLLVVAVCSFPRNITSPGLWGCIHDLLCFLVAKSSDFLFAELAFEG